MAHEVAMTDRELLELAAKAAGLRVCWHEGDGDAARHMDLTEPPRIFWNPLTDEGDALRLAVNLGFSIVTEPYSVEVCALDGETLATEEVLLDGYAATRRAIVRAAASIGADKEDKPHG